HPLPILPPDESCRDDAVRYMSVLAGSQPPTRTDSHGHCPRNTLTSTNLKARTARGSAAHRKGHGTAHRKAPPCDVLLIYDVRRSHCNLWSRRSACRGGRLGTCRALAVWRFAIRSA